MTRTASEQKNTPLTSFPCVNFANDLRLLEATYQVQAIMSTFFSHFFSHAVVWCGAQESRLFAVSKLRRLSLFPSHLQGGIVLAVPVDLVAHHGAAEPAPVLVFVAFRQDQKQCLYHRHCPFARGAVELSGLEFIKA